MRKKITIIGAGKVGSTIAQMAAYKELGDIVLVNRTVGLARGISLDMEEGAPLEGYDVKITGTGDYKDTKGSDVVVITAGLARKPGMSRDDLLAQNAAIIRDIAEKVAKNSPKAIVIVITNPLDAMVYLTYRVTRFPKNRVLGMAGVLDSSRFRSFIAMELGVAVEDVNALVLGGHGDFMLPLINYATVGGIPVTELIQKSKLRKIVERTRDAGGEIVRLEGEGSAYYAPAYSAVQMIESIIKDKKRILPCAAYMNGEYGIEGIFMGVPVKLGAAGVEEILEVRLTKHEAAALKKSAKEVKKLVSKLNM